MGWDGFERALCKNGHLQTSHGPYCEVEKECPDCGELTVWWEIVDQTNDGGVETELEIYKDHVCKCKECGVIHQTKPTQYFIPDRTMFFEFNKERKIKSNVPVVAAKFRVNDTGNVFDSVEEALEDFRRWERETYRL